MEETDFFQHINLNFNDFGLLIKLHVFLSCYNENYIELNILAGYDEEGAYVPPVEEEDDDDEEEEEIDESIHFDEATEIRYTIHTRPQPSYGRFHHIFVLLSFSFFNLTDIELSINC